LPEGSSLSIIDAFLATVISIISLKQDPLYVQKSMRCFLNYLRNDANVFSRFKPHKPLMRKMNLAVHIMGRFLFILAQNDNESELALEFCNFLLRYHRDLDYGDFSDNPYVVQKLRRYEDFKCWAELEELQQLQDQSGNKLDKFKSTNEQAMQEILQHMERIAREYQTKEEIAKEFGNVQDQVMSEMDRRIKQYIAEQAEDLRQMIPAQSSQGLDSGQYKKALELMLDLEKKTDQRFDEIALETKKEMDRMADDKQLRADIQQMVDEKIENIEFNINNKVVSRVELLEKSYDTQAQN